MYFFFSLINFIHFQLCACAREEEKSWLQAALVVRLCRLGSSSCHKRHLHILHLAVRASVREGVIHSMGHHPDTVHVPEHLHHPASEGENERFGHLSTNDISISIMTSIY